MDTGIRVIKENVSRENLFPSPLYRMTLFNKIRWRNQYEYGYRVYRLLDESGDVGYCGISDGGIGDYPHASGDDIIIGPYFVSEDQRGKGYAARMIDLILKEHELTYDKAWIHIATDNTPSIKTAENLGFEMVFRAVMNDKHQLEKSDDGNYCVYCRSNIKQ